jgi:hypothetical protein
MQMTAQFRVCLYQSSEFIHPVCNEDADYFNQIVATRKKGVSDLVLAKEHLTLARSVCVCAATVLRSAIREAAKHEGLLDLLMNHHRMNVLKRIHSPGAFS